MLKENNQGGSRPLRDEALVCDPAVIIRTHGVIHVWTPGHVGKNIEHVHQLAGVQSTVSVLKQNNHDSEALIKQDQVQNKCTIWSISVPVYYTVQHLPRFIPHITNYTNITETDQPNELLYLTAK